MGSRLERENQIALPLGVLSKLTVALAVGFWAVGKTESPEVTGIKPLEQRLIHGLQELADAALLEDVLSTGHPEVGRCLMFPDVWTMPGRRRFPNISRLSGTRKKAWSGVFGCRVRSLW